MNPFEVRSAPLEIRAEEEDGRIRLRCAAAVFNQRSENLGGFFEVIEPGFFRDVLGGDTVAAWEHRTDFVLGRTTATPPTLALAETDRNLLADIFPADNSRNRDWVLTPIGRGEVRHMSFAFHVGPGGDQWGELPDGNLLRTLLPGGCSRLSDVSPVTRPAYLGTDVAMRSLDAWRKDHPGDRLEIEREALRALARLRLQEIGS